MHPELEEKLRWWKDVGFELVHGRKPTPDDWIVPSRKDSTKPHTRSSGYKLFQRACDKVDVDAHSLHSTRHTFITWARRGGAREDVLETITHNASGRMIDQYTHWHWEPLCDAVLCLSYGEESSDGSASPPAGGPPPDSHDAVHDAEGTTPDFLGESGWRRRESKTGRQVSNR